ncbi:MAG: sensor histidine kinase [bacterium]
MIYLIIIILIFLTALLLFLLFRYERNIKEVIEYTEDLLNDKYSSKILKKVRGSISKLIKNLNTLAEKLETKKSISGGQEELLNIIFEGMKEGLILTKVNGEIVLANSSIKNIFGGKSFQKDRVIQELIIHREFIEFTNKPPNGKKIDSMELELLDLARFFVVSRFYLESQQYFVYIFNDITDAKNLKRIKADFITNLSHELRTPLTAIKGYLEALEEPDLNSKSREKFIKIVRENIERLTNIVSDLLVLSDIERPERKLNKERVDLNELTEEVISLLRKTADEKGLNLSFTPTQIPDYYGDKFLLQQLLINLVSNGIRFTEKGKVDVNIRYESQKFHITISDTGIGIPSEEIPKIFERFYTVDKARSRMQGGTGLGLSIVKHIVQLHQGEIKVESRLREGSKFTVILPLTAEFYE